MKFKILDIFRPHNCRKNPVRNADPDDDSYKGSLDLRVFQRVDTISSDKDYLVRAILKMPVDKCLF